MKQAWEKCGLSQVLYRAQQFEAMAFCMNAPAEVLGEEEEEAVVNVTDSKEEEDEEEEEGGQDDQHPSSSRHRTSAAGSIYRLLRVRGSIVVVAASRDALTFSHYCS